MNEELRVKRVDIDSDQLATVCRRHHFSSLQVFGSILRDDFNDQSDVDVLVELEPGHTPGFLKLHVVAEELSALFQGRRIDLVTRQALSPRLRDRVVASAEVLFAA